MLCVAFDAKRNLFHKNYLVGVKENRKMVSPQISQITPIEKKDDSF